MNVTALTLRDLEYLCAVGELTHFGKAAQRCHVSQPALSAQIRKIEDTLGAQVFERSNRKVAVTAIGAELIRQARVILDEARKLHDIAQGHKEPLAGTLRLGAIATLGPYYVPHLIGPLKKKYPKLQLNLVEGLTAGLLEMLRNGELDAVLASPTFAEQGFRVFPLFFEPFVLLAPKAHDLTKKAELRPGDLRAAEMVLLEEGHCLKDQALETCPTNRRGSVRRFHATSLETLKSLVATGHGYTLIPALAAESDSRLKDLVHYRGFESKSVGRVIALVCRERFSRMRDIEELAAFIRKNMPAGMMPIDKR